jgi:hypothetical protein
VALTGCKSVAVSATTIVTLTSYTLKSLMRLYLIFKLESLKMATKNKPVAQAAQTEVAQVAATETTAATPVVEAKPKKNLGYKKLSQFQLPDGTIVATQKEASEFARKHLVTDALLKVAGGDQTMADWLLANKDAIQAAYAAAEIKRNISDETRAKMREALLARKAAGKM